jgi:hypothetical protein
LQTESGPTRGGGKKVVSHYRSSQRVDEEADLDGDHCTEEDGHREPVEKLPGSRCHQPEGGYQDIAQEAALQAFLGLAHLREPMRFAAWFHAIAVNLARSALRRRREHSLEAVDLLARL